MKRSPEYRIRPYCDADREKLAQITVICFQRVSIDQNIERMFGTVGGTTWEQRKAAQVYEDLDLHPDGVFVATCDNLPIGYITAWPNPGTRVGWIPNLAVLPEHQQKGLGQRLIQAALDYFRSEGMAAARIETLEQNPVGQHFYPKMGFCEVARQIHYVCLLDS